MSEISTFRPASRQRIMDLLQVVGVDVSDWKNFKGGIKRAASNPKYCYSWSFVQPDKVVVLNLWYDDLKISNGRITQELDLRKDARQYADWENQNGIDVRSKWIKRFKVTYRMSQPVLTGLWVVVSLEKPANS
jgi:hypothetical protein